jgi:hypothetical protein
MKTLLTFLLLTCSLFAQQPDASPRKQLKTWGDAKTQTILSVQTFDDTGLPDLDSLKPLRPEPNQPEWTPPTLVPLVKLPKPELAEGQKAEPKLVWFADRVERQWDVITKTAEEIAKERKALYPEAEMYQIHEWMHDNGLDPDAVPQIISAAFPPGLERKKALSRWNKAVRVPRDHPLVDVIGTRLTPPLTPEQIDAAWGAILTR